MLDFLRENDYHHQVGPGVYDIHSPRIPPQEEIEGVLMKMKDKLRLELLWVNPDCGLKTRQEEEAIPSLKNMVNATLAVRKKLGV